MGRNTEGHSKIQLIVGSNVLLSLVYSVVYMYDGLYAVLRAAKLADAVAESVYFVSDQPCWPGRSS